MILVLLSLQGCAAYTLVSITTIATTSKGPMDHATSLVSGHECNIAQPLKGQYYCEVVPRYNRNPI